MSSTPNAQSPQSSGEPSNSRAQKQPTNTNQAAEFSPNVEDTAFQRVLNAEIEEFIDGISPTTARMRRRRREANLAELKRLFGMSPDTTHDQLHTWILDNLSVLTHCSFNMVPDPRAYIEYKGTYIEPSITNPRAREITKRILTIVGITEWPNDQEMKNALASCENPDHFLARRKYITDLDHYRMWKPFASKEFQEALEEYRKEELARRERRPKSLLKQMELAYPESSEAGSSNE